MNVATPIPGVFSEVGTLRCVLTHCPDQGVGRVTPSKAQEWLYEDIVHLQKMQREYAYFRKILLAYLDPDVLLQWLLRENKSQSNQLSAALASSPDFIPSSKVIDAEELLIQILAHAEIRQQLVASICAIENVNHRVQRYLLDAKRISAKQLAQVLLTGVVEDEMVTNAESNMIFPPVPNFLFTRDIGITIGEYFLLSKAALSSRKRESILAKYIGYYALFRDCPEKIIELTKEDSSFLQSQHDNFLQAVTIEGGDVMMISPRHVLIGCSERTTAHACAKVVKRLFALKYSGVEKVSIVKIPRLRAMMHLDTVMTQVDRKTWVLYKPLLGDDEVVGRDYIANLIDANAQQFSRVALVSQFIKANNEKGYELNPAVSNLKSLLLNVSCDDFGCSADEVTFIYSAGAKALDDEREQWTDSCNVVAIKEGVVLGYDRNDLTAKAFNEAGFETVYVKALIDQLSEQVSADETFDIAKFIEKNVPNKALLLLPSAEISRARGGPHCMTMPIVRESVK